MRQRPAPSQGQDEEAVILDKGASFRVEKILYQEYLQEPERRTLIQEVWQRALRLANERRAKGQRSLQPKRIVRAQHEERRGAMDHYSTLRTAVQMFESYLRPVDDDGRMMVDESGEEAGEEDPQNNPAP